MRQILLIKLTSLGDLIHALPAITDASRAYPDIQFDWMIDESFHEIALLHPNVKRLYMTNHRKWGVNKPTFEQLGRLISDVRQTSYDLVIDGQGNFKTALLSLFTRGLRAGYDRHSVREWIAHFAYQQKHPASRKAHAIERLRRLFSSALGYPLPETPPDFQIQRHRLTPPPIELPSDYFVFVHSASWKSKLWPERHWAELIRLAERGGSQVLLPWGNEEELARAKRIAASSTAQVLPRLRLTEIGYILSRAKGAVCMDTGLSHLTVALNIPSVTLYGATDSGLIGASGTSQSQLQAKLKCAPCQKKMCRYSTEENLCLAGITPQEVYRDLLRQASLRYL